MSFCHRPLTLAVLAALAGATPAAAQLATTTSSSLIGTSATVLSPIAIVSGQPLVVGGVLRTPKRVAPDDASSGRFMVYGQSAAAIRITLALPEVLADSASHTIAISGWQGRYGTGADTAGGVPFVPVPGTPGGSVLPDILSSTAATHFFRLGATVRPRPNQASGRYTGVIAVNAAYTEL